MSLSKEQIHLTEDIGLLISFATSIGVGLTFGRARDTEANQKILFDKGMSNTMNSAHLNALAVDFNIFIDGNLTYDKSKTECLGVFWENLDNKNKWGGRFKTPKGGWDVGHFERRRK